MASLRAKWKKGEIPSQIKQVDEKINVVTEMERSLDSVLGNLQKKKAALTNVTRISDCLDILNIKVLNRVDESDPVARLTKFFLKTSD